MRKLSALWLLILAIAGCGVGPRVRDFIPATSPAGVYSIIRMRDQTHEGELLALDDSAFVLITRDGVVQIPFSVIIGAEFAQVKRISAASAADFRGSLGRHLRLVSRFPQGLTPELLSALLRSRQQNEMIRARPRSVGSAQSMLLQARAATALYQDRRAAIAAGYRLV